jgi:hypothetical protein
MPTDLGYTTDVKIGPDVNSVQDVKIEPHVEFLPGISRERTVTSQEKYVGGLRCRWTYPNRQLTGEQYYQLKSLVGEQMSGPVVIDIPTQTMNTATYTPVVATYNAIMHWPEKGVTRVSFNQWQFPNDGILFTQLTSI